MGREQAIRIVAGIHHRIERDVVVLKCVHQFMRNQEPHRDRISSHAEKQVTLRIVKSGNLFGEDSLVERPELDGIRKKSQEPINFGDMLPPPFA